VDGKLLTLGISGYLYRSAVLYYDRQSESFWSQMTGECVVGPSLGKKLKWIPSEVTTWAKWKAAHPKTTVLAPYYDMKRYKQMAINYRGYFARGKPISAFLGEKVEYPKTYKPFDLCTIVKTKKGARCYPHPALEEGSIKDGDLTITKKGKQVTVRDKQGNLVPSLQGFWFAFFAFYPDGTVWKPEN
jgi:hypothetical protein